MDFQFREFVSKNMISKIQKIKNQAGFTIIETMIAMSLFTVLITVGMGATLDAINQHKQAENMRTAMDGLNFAIEDMARNIRLGSNLHCDTPAVDPITGNPIPHDCPDTSGSTNVLMFNDLNGGIVTYAITPDYSTLPAPVAGILQKQVGSNPVQKMLPPEVVIEFAKSGFTVRGAVPGDSGQPTVVIRLAGYVKYKTIKSNFAVQTTVALRALDS
jgi:prepilin-type N-terminal cleavage/methylation domain-containing protein